VRAIKFLHEHKVVHRDLKLENILLDKNFNLKVADFGLSVKSKFNAAEKLSVHVGTEKYMAPEMVAGK
jgi:polo-like kinase 1